MTREDLRDIIPALAIIVASIATYCACIIPLAYSLSH